jgi:pectate lyase
MEMQGKLLYPLFALLSLTPACGGEEDSASPTGSGARGGTSPSAQGGAAGSGAGGVGASAGTGGAAAGNGGTNASGSGGSTPGSGGGAGSSNGGSGGGIPLPCTGTAPAVSDQVIGWAAVSGDGVETTTGGLGGETVTATSPEELASYAASSAPLIIRIESSMDIGTLDVVSNKTLLGIGPDVTLRGGIRVRPLKSDDPIVSNVVIRNLHVDAATSVPDDGGDGIHIERAHHVWVDHCEIWDAPDGNTDVTHGSNWVTVSWTRYRYTAAAPNQDHRFSNLIGHSEDTADTDAGRLKVTYHHVHWAENVEQRMPRVRFGEVHVFNNYIAAIGAQAAVAAGTEAKLLVENNHFEGVKDPHFFHEGSTTAEIAATGNIYVNVTGKKDVGQGPAFTAPYQYALDPAEQIACDVSLGAGPR